MVNFRPVGNHTWFNFMNMTVPMKGKNGESYNVCLRRHCSDAYDYHEHRPIYYGEDYTAKTFMYMDTDYNEYLQVPRQTWVYVDLWNIKECVYAWVQAEIIVDDEWQAVDDKELLLDILEYADFGIKEENYWLHPCPTKKTRKIHT